MNDNKNDDSDHTFNEDEILLSYSRFTHIWGHRQHNGIIYDLKWSPAFWMSPITQNENPDDIMDRTM